MSDGFGSLDEGVLPIKKGLFERFVKPLPVVEEVQLPVVDKQVEAFSSWSNALLANNRIQAAVLQDLLVEIKVLNKRLEDLAWIAGGLEGIMVELKKANGEEVK